MQDARTSTPVEEGVVDKEQIPHGRKPAENVTETVKKALTDRPDHATGITSASDPGSMS